MSFLRSITKPVDNISSGIGDLFSGTGKGVQGLGEGTGKGIAKFGEASGNFVSDVGGMISNPIFIIGVGVVLVLVLAK